MRKLIKSSFVLALLLGIVSMGLNNAAAKNVKNNKVNNNTRIAPLPCSMHSTVNLALFLHNGSQTSFNLVAALDPSCEPKTYRSGNYIVIVQSDCTVKRVKIDPGGLVPVKKA
jgi:hypothetical protein